MEQNVAQPAHHEQFTGEDHHLPNVLGEYMDEAALAAALNVSRRTLARWRALGEAPPHTLVGRRIMFHRESVDRWLRQREVEAV